MSAGHDSVFANAAMLVMAGEEDVDYLAEQSSRFANTELGDRYRAIVALAQLSAIPRLVIAAEFIRLGYHRMGGYTHPNYQGHALYLRAMASMPMQVLMCYPYLLDRYGLYEADSGVFANHLELKEIIEHDDGSVTVKSRA